MRKFHLIVYILVSFMALQNCTDKKAAEEAPKEEKPAEKDTSAGETVELTGLQYETIGVELGKMEEKNLKSVVKSTGHLKLPPQKLAAVSTFMGGVVKKIYVIEGDYVKEGQTLATIEHPDFTKLQEEYLKTRDNLKYLSKEYERQKELYAKNVTSGKTFQQTEATYESELSRLASLKDQLTKLSISLAQLDQRKIVQQIPIKSPIAGYVSVIHINTGSFAEPIKTLFEVVDNSHIHVDLNIYEQDWYKVKKGQKIMFTLPNEGDKQIEGEIFAVGKSFDPVTRALAVHAEIKNNKLGLVPGIYVDALIDVGVSKVEALPREAIVQTGGQNYIFVFIRKKTENNQPVYVYEMKEVKTGVSDLGYTEVHPLEELGTGKDSIVVKGAYYLLSKLKNVGEEE